MSIKSRYNIAFKGLSQGKHDFDFTIDKKFFEAFESDLIEDGTVDVRVTLDKQSALMVLWFKISGTLSVTCDRCLEPYSQKVKSENRIFVKFGDEDFSEGDDVIWLSVNDYQVNVAQLIYEFIVLSLPLHRVHPDDEDGNSTCNPDMLERLSAMQAIISDEDDEDEEDSDSTWDELRKLLE